MFLSVNTYVPSQTVFLFAVFGQVDANNSANQAGQDSGGSKTQKTAKTRPNGLCGHVIWDVVKDTLKLSTMTKTLLSP